MDRRKPALLDRTALLQYAARALAGRALSVSELRTRLVRRAAQAGDVDDVIATLRDAKALDDRRFAESYAAARLENQGFGKMRVLRDLRVRRVAGEVAREVVEGTFANTNEIELIEQFLARKFRSVELRSYLADPKHLNSVFRRLRMAGFGATPAIRVLKRYAAEAEALEDIAEEPEP
jgi:regulatory protein